MASAFLAPTGLAWMGQWSRDHQQAYRGPAAGRRSRPAPDWRHSNFLMQRPHSAAARQCAYLGLLSGNFAPAKLEPSRLTRTRLEEVRRPAGRSSGPRQLGRPRGEQKQRAPATIRRDSRLHPGHSSAPTSWPSQAAGPASGDGHGTRDTGRGTRDSGWRMADSG